MISIENFYWILFENLLKPVGLDAWHYYPFGTQDHLSCMEFNPRQPKQEHHVLFYHDQEPIWSGHLNSLYDFKGLAWSAKLARVLANSEYSSMKKAVCGERGMLDWYFFFHGFAALDWYRDARYVDRDHPVQNAFLSLNHNLDQRAYRMALLVRLIDKKIVRKGSISFHANLDDIVRESQNSNTKLSMLSRIMIQQHQNQLSDLPWILDKVDINGSLSARFGHQEYKMWQSSLWHLVNETVFYEPKLHLTEKVFKPIVAGRPFVLIAAPGNLEYLRSYGFKTFDRWIDESYDNIHDPDQRLDAIVHEISKFAGMSTGELNSIHESMVPVLRYNKQHFFGKFREIIVSELVDNFDQCVRIWNNGRFDDRSLPVHLDLGSVKKQLLS